MSLKDKYPPSIMAELPMKKITSRDHWKDLF